MNSRNIRAAASLMAVLAAASGAAMAYTVITRDGHMIHAQAKPEVRGMQAFMRLAPSGELAVIADGKIDWQRTDAVNPITAPIAIPSSTMMTQAPAPKGTGKPIDLKLYGGQQAKTAAATPPIAAPSQPKPNAAEAIITLQKEYAQVTAARDTEAAAKTMMEQELSQLQSRDVGYASETSANEQRIRELTERIATSGSRISMLETRLGDIRSEVVQLGGSVD